MQDNKYFAIFGGGGIRGIAYSGAYKALLENNIELTGYAGSSIGAVFATLLALDYNYDEIYQIFESTGFQMFIDINTDFKREIGISKGNIFLDWIREKIEQKFYEDDYKKGQMKPVTFSDIKKKLIIYSVDLTNLKFKEFSFFKTPDFEIAMAVRASVSMPGLFKPFEIENNLIVDGDLLKSTPLWRASNSIKDLNERIIEFRLEDNETPKQIKNSFEYLNRVYNAICGFATDYIIDLYNEKDKFDYIKINTQDICVVDFLIPKEKRLELFNLGYEKTMTYFKNSLPEKRKKNREKYKKLLDFLKSLKNELKKKNSINSYLKLCEMFVFLCEEKKYLDVVIYNEIVKLKDEFTKNYKTVSFLGLKSGLIANKDQLTVMLDEIINLVQLKV